MYEWPQNEECGFYFQRAHVEFQDHGCQLKSLQGPRGLCKWGARSGPQRRWYVLHLKGRCCSAQLLLLSGKGVLFLLKRKGEAGFRCEIFRTVKLITYSITHMLTHMHSQSHESETAPAELFPSRVYTGLSFWKLPSIVANVSPCHSFPSMAFSPAVPLSQLSQLPLTHSRRGEISHSSFQKASQCLRILKGL